MSNGATAAVDTSELWQAERDQAGRLGFRLLVKVEEETTLSIISAVGGDQQLVAICRLMPETPRARAVCFAQRAEFIEAQQRFRDNRDAVFALGDAIRAGLDLARDAS